MDILNSKSVIFFNGPSDEQVVCLTIETVLIPPNTEKLLELAVSNTAYVNRTTVFESFDQVGQSLLFAKLTDTVTDNKIKVLAFKFSDKPIELKSGQPMGRVEAIEDCQLSRHRRKS